jgi:hypothetical protein
MESGYEPIEAMSLDQVIADLEREHPELLS